MKKDSAFSAHSDSITKRNAMLRLLKFIRKIIHICAVFVVHIVLAKMKSTFGLLPITSLQVVLKSLVLENSVTTQ